MINKSNVDQINKLFEACGIDKKLVPADLEPSEFPVQEKFYRSLIEDAVTSFSSNTLKGRFSPPFTQVARALGIEDNVRGSYLLRSCSAARYLSKKSEEAVTILALASICFDFNIDAKEFGERLRCYKIVLEQAFKEIEDIHLSKLLASIEKPKPDSKGS